MHTPAYKLTFRQDVSGSLGPVTNLVQSAAGAGGGKVIDTTDEPQASTLVELLVKLDMEAPADSFTLVMGQVGSFRPGRTDQVVIELGYSDNGGLNQVMTGSVVRVESGLTTRRVVGHSAAETLLHTFVDTHYESKTAGEMVEDMASEAGIAVARAESGINFSAYVVDGRRSVYQHMQDLAALCGFDLYINHEGELVMEKFVGGKTVHVFEYAKHILSLDMQQGLPQATLVQTWGESPGGGQAQEAWAWLTKDFEANHGEAGSGEALLLVEKPALRNAQAARTSAQALNTHIQRQSLRGRLLLTGQPQVRLGDAIRFSELPDESLNNSFQVRSITHRITKGGGFITQVIFRSLADAV